MSFGGGGGAGAGGTGRDLAGSATVYTPAQQPTADVNFQNILQGMINAGSGPAGQVWSPAVNYVQHWLTGVDASGQPLPGGDVTAVTNQNQAFGGAQTAADYGIGTLFPQAQGGSAALYQAALSGFPYGSSVLGQGFDPAYGALVSGSAANPYYGDALSGAQTAAGYGPTLQAATAGQAGRLGTAADTMLNTAFDPQSALFNRTQQQLIDQSNAVNAMSGLAGTPYGASTTANALGNFDINWQNALLGRQQSGLGAAGPAYRAAAGLGLEGALGGAQLAGLPSSVYMGNLAGQLPYLNARNQAGIAGIGGLNAILSGANQGLAGAQNLGYGGATQLGQLSAMPWQTGTGFASTALQGLGGLSNLGQQQYLLPQQTLNDLESYLRLGQSASGLSGQLGNLGINQWGQIGQGLGGLAGLGGNWLGLNNGGLGSLLGLGSSDAMAGLGGFQGGSWIPGATDFWGGADLLGAGFGAAGAGAAAGGGADLGLLSALAFL